MRTFVSRLGLLTVALALSAGGSQAAEWGTLKGRILFDGKPPAAKPIVPTKDQAVCDKCKLVEERLVVGPSGGIANVVVFLRTKTDVAPSYDNTAADKVSIDNHCCRFVPHVQLLRTSQKLVVKNSDPIGHNSNLQGFLNAGANPIVPANGEVQLEFKSEEGLPMKVTCNIHPWMEGYVVVRSSPYMAVTDENGEFTVKDLPAGKDLEFQLWHELSGYLKNASFKGGKSDSKGRFKLKLTGDTDLGEMKAPANVFKK